MKFYVLPRIAPRAAGLGLLFAASSAGLAFADAPVPNKGDTAWMLTSTAIVLMMSIPGLALFYAGMARAKNAAALAAQVFAIVGLVSIIGSSTAIRWPSPKGFTSRFPFSAGSNGTILSAALTAPSSWG